MNVVKSIVRKENENIQSQQPGKSGLMGIAPSNFLWKKTVS